jgi:hypothetical protein
VHEGEEAGHEHASADEHQHVNLDINIDNLDLNIDLHDYHEQWHQWAAACQRCTFAEYKQSTAAREYNHPATARKYKYKANNNTDDVHYEHPERGQQPTTTRHY